MMSKSGAKNIADAIGIIEKFGGIRPMSAKINVAVTTIQGWKKRDSIPANRKALLLSAAEEHKIDLSEFFDDAPVVGGVAEAEEDSASVEDIELVDDEENVQEQEKTVSKESDESEKNQEDEPVVISEPKQNDSPRSEKPKSNAFTEIAVTTERRAITKSTIIAACMVFIVVVAVILTLWPDYETFNAHKTTLSQLEDEVSDIKKKQTSFKGLVPENWGQQLEDLKKQVEQTKAVVNDSVQVVKDVSNDLQTEHGLEKRVVQLQSYVSEIAGSSGAYALMDRFDTMRTSYAGQRTIDDVVSSLTSLYSTTISGDNSADDDVVNARLNQARSQDRALAQTFENVPESEMKAAAMLFALTQVRSALNRGEGNFEGDLKLLLNMVGDDNPELRLALEKLSPHAKSGLLSAQGLSAEFRTVAGDAVAASLSGEDVSFSEKLSARMNGILKVEKDGEMVTGSETQKTVDQAQKLVEKNYLADAMDLLQDRLNDKELAPLRPWMRKAEGVLTASKVKRAIDQAIELNTGRGYLGGEQILTDSP